MTVTNPTTQEVAVSQFSTTTPGTLPAGTVTELGTVVASTLTAYKMVDGSFVPFAKVHGAPSPVEPLVVFA